MRQNQYQNLMKMMKSCGIIETNQGQKDYMELYQEPIQIGTRLGDLTRNGYLNSHSTGKRGNIWTLTQKGIDWEEGQYLVIKNYPKIKKTKAESEAKQLSKEINEGLDRIYGLQEHTPPIEPTTIWGQIKYFLSQLFK